MNKEKTKKCPFCAEEINQEAIICKHCNKELDKNKVKKAEHKWSPIKIVIVVLFTITIIIMSISCSSTNTTQPKIIQKQPTWYGNELIIASSEFDFISSKKINVWPAYNNRSQALGMLNEGDIIKIIGYNSANNYCKIQKENIKGWIACGWIQGLPNNMINY